jgi:hypothetical protein
LIETPSLLQFCQGILPSRVSSVIRWRTPSLHHSWALSCHLQGSQGSPPLHSRHRVSPQPFSGHIPQHVGHIIFLHSVHWMNVDDSPAMILPSRAGRIDSRMSLSSFVASLGLFRFFGSRSGKSPASISFSPLLSSLSLEKKLNRRFIAL